MMCPLRDAEIQCVWCEDTTSITLFVHRADDNRQWRVGSKFHRTDGEDDECAPCPHCKCSQFRIVRWLGKVYEGAY